MWCATIEIIPEPQKQTRFVMRGKYPIAYDPSKSYSDKLKWQLLSQKPAQIETGPISLSLNFYMPIPKSTSKVKIDQMLIRKIHHIKRPDLDNMGYAVTNALKGIYYADDSQVVSLHMYKSYSMRPRITIEAFPLTDLSD